jgi:hypothetical protein
MQARTLLAIVALLQLIAICLNFTLAAYVIWITLPFAIAAFLGVTLAIYCGWRTGIWIFIGKRVRVRGCEDERERARGRARDCETVSSVDDARQAWHCCF